MTRRCLHLWFMLCVLVPGVLVLGACRAPWDPAKAARAEADARQILHSLQGPDMAAYRELSLPPPEWQALQRDWPEIRRKLTLSEGDRKYFDKWLRRLTEPQAEARLLRDFNAKIKPLKGEIDDKWPLMQASLTLLLQGWIESNQQLSATEKAHGKALIKAVIEQMPPESLLDPALQQRALAQVVAMARATGISSYHDYNALSYVDFHRDLSIFITGLKELGEVYGFDWNAEQARLEVKAIEQSGRTARVLVRYPLGRKWVEFPMDLIEYEGHWYDASAAKLVRMHTKVP